MPNHTVCTRCVMDTTDPDIVFDQNGVCNHCHGYARRSSSELLDQAAARDKLQRQVAQIKKDGLGHRYDCIIGVSGGVDSTYVAYLVKELGLRPLAVHLDNGWDAELAVKNIQTILEHLHIDLYTLVLDWDEFRDLQNAFFQASVANVEALTDHAINASLFMIAAKEHIRYIISGSNLVTEAIMPPSWMYDNRDWRHIKGIHKRFGTLPIRTYPHAGLLKYFYYIVIRGIKYISILNYCQYNKHEAKAFLLEMMGWRDYGGKHYESIFTRFFQAYFLPNKFGMDKRLPHLSSMICAGQITREQALEELRKPAYPPELFKDDYVFFLKKMGYTHEDFDAIMKSPTKTYRDYPSNSMILGNPKLVRLVKRLVKPRLLKK